MNSLRKLTKNGSKCRNARSSGAADHSKRTLRSLRNLVDQKTITDFVMAVEEKKGFLAEPDKIFRHIVSEVGELDAAMYELDKLQNEAKDSMLHTDGLKNFFSKKVGEELLDIIFLACYMAKVYGVNLNEIAPDRVAAIKREYGVKWPA